MLNTVVLMGRLVEKPELRHTADGRAVAKFTLAVDRNYAKQGAERQTDFIEVVAWRNTADFVTRYFHKGQLVAVQGSLQTRSYTDNQGIKRKGFNIQADSVYFAEAKRDTYQNAPESDYQPAPSFQNAGYGDFEEMQTDDDLPF